MASLVRAYKYRLYPTATQRRLMEETLETCRRWYNICLAERKEAWENEKRSLSFYDQEKGIKVYRQENEYAARVVYAALLLTTQDLDKAFKNFFRRVKAGQKPGYPRFKGRDRFDSFGYPHYGNGYKIDGRRLKLTNIGRVSVRWHRPLEGEIKQLRICRHAGKWYACFSCEVEPKPLPPTGQEIGIDMGVSHLLMTSEGEAIENPKWYQSEQRKLRVLQRRVSRRKKGGANRRKAIEALGRQHERITNRRADYIKKTVHDLIVRYDCIAIEDLQVANMSHNRHLSKNIMDAGWGYFRLQLFSKAEEAGRTVVAVSPAYTSKTCSNCGVVFEDLTLADRWVECPCGLSLDRDHNAALNILRVGRTRWGLTWPAAASVPQEPVANGVIEVMA